MNIRDLSYTLSKAAASSYSKWGWVAVFVPTTMERALKRLQREIDTDDLAEDGAEKEPHVTIAYGLSDNVDKNRLKLTFALSTPVTFRVEDVSAFTDNPKYDVLKYRVKSGELSYLRRRVREDFGIPGTTYRYNPHVTIAYVKKGKAEKYLKKFKQLVGRSYTTTSAVYNPKGYGKRYRISIGRGQFAYMHKEAEHADDAAPEGKCWRVLWADGRAQVCFRNKSHAQEFWDSGHGHSWFEGVQNGPKLVDRKKGWRVGNTPRKFKCSGKNWGDEQCPRCKKEGKPFKRKKMEKQAYDVKARTDLARDEVTKLIQKLEKRTGRDFGDTPVRAGRSSITADMLNYYIPKNLKEVPSRLVRPVTTVATMGAAPSVALLNALIMKWIAVTGKNAAYTPSFSRVGTGDKPPYDLLAHELGHYIDFEHGEAPYSRSKLQRFGPMAMFSKPKELAYMTPMLAAELNATMFAHGAMTEKEWKKSMLPAALSSYLMHHAKNRPRSLIRDLYAERGTDRFGPDDWKEYYAKFRGAADHKTAKEYLDKAILVAGHTGAKTKMDRKGRVTRSEPDYKFDIGKEYKATTTGTAAAPIVELSRKLVEDHASGLKKKASDQQLDLARHWLHGFRDKCLEKGVDPVVAMDLNTAGNEVN